MTDWKSNHIANDGITCTIARTTPYTGKMIIAKMKGSTSDYSVGNRRLINALLASNLATGEIVTAGSETLICVVSKKEVIQGTDISIIGHGLICNTTLTVTRDVLTYDSNGNVTGSTASTIVNSAYCRVDQVTARMRQEDAGLLPGTVMKVYTKDASTLVLLDKASVAGSFYRVDDINRLEIPGAMVLQLGVWAG